MRFELLFLGKTKEQYLERGIADFVTRLRRFVALEIVTIKAPRPPKSAGGGPRAAGQEARLLAAEARLLLERVSAAALLVALDPGGIMPTSPELAARVQQWREQGRERIVFVLGGPLGLAPEVLARADLVLSLSRLTYTHEMARLLLVEQLYRAFAIINNTGYHK